MLKDIKITISRKDYQRLLCNLEPHERFVIDVPYENLVIYPDRNMCAPKIILEVRKKKSDDVREKFLKPSEALLSFEEIVEILHDHGKIVGDEYWEETIAQAIHLAMKGKGGK